MVTMQDSTGSWLAQTGFAASIGKGVQLLISRPLFFETEHISRRNEPNLGYLVSTGAK